MTHSNSDVKKVLFFRDFKGFSGGHLKVWHYFNHLKNTKNYSPYILFSEDSLWNETNPWLSIKNEVLTSEQDINPDVSFLAGLDWIEWKKININIPIINFIQGVRHGNPQLPLYSFLKNKAIRICVSEEVRNVLTQSKQVNGPIYTIPNGIDKDCFPDVLPLEQRNIDILIAGLKNKEIALRLYEYLKPLNKRVKILTQSIPQKEYLSYVNQSQIAVFLPHFTEGFYLPALEGMALDSLVICPDCVGNRSFCLSGFNCFQPEYSLDGLFNAVNNALSISEQDKQKMLINAKLTASQHTLEGEQKAFLDIMDNITQIW